MNPTKLRKDLEALVTDFEATQEENNRLKVLLYRLIATHGNMIEPISYLPRKALKIHNLRVFNTNNSITFVSKDYIEVIPNDSNGEI